MILSSKKKVGALSNAEKDFIIEHMAALTNEQIGEEIGRTPKAVAKFIDDYQVKQIAEDFEEEEFVRYRNMLHGKVYWADLKDQYTDNEIRVFERLWIELMQQFRGDVLAAEEIRIEQLISLKILCNRCMRDRKKHEDTVIEFERERDEIYKFDIEDRDLDRLSVLEQNISMARAGLNSYSTEYTKILNEYKYIEKALKANRDERIKRIEESQGSWQGWLRRLEDPNERKELGREIELMAVATEKARQQLSELYVFPDGKVDQPLLNHETYDPDLYKDIVED